MPRQLVVLALSVVLLLHQLPTTSYAQGAAILRIQDESSHCINPTRERVWLSLRRLITQRTRGWFSEDDSIAILVKANVTTDPPANERISYPLMSEFTFGTYPTGQVSVPVEYFVVSGLNLLQDDYLYTGLSVELTLLNIRQRNSWGNALKALGEITDNLSIPASPAAQAGSYLLEFTNSAVDRDLEDQDENDKARSAALALSFDPTGTCGNDQNDDFERTGTFAVIQSTGAAGDGLIPIDRTDEYCWDADLRPEFILKAAPKPSGGVCDDQVDANEYIRVSNNYVAFFLNARLADGVRSLSSERSFAEQADAYTIEAYERCRAHGIVSVEECFP